STSTIPTSCRKRRSIEGSNFSTAERAEHAEILNAMSLQDETALLDVVLLVPLASFYGFFFPRAAALVWRLPRGLLAASLWVWTIQIQKAGLMAAGWSSLRVVLAACIFYDFFGLRTQRKVFPKPAA